MSFRCEIFVPVTSPCLAVFKLNCLVVNVLFVALSEVVVDLSGSTLDVGVFGERLQLVHSYMLCRGKFQQAFFTSQTLEIVRDSINTAGIVARGFSFWNDFCGD